MPAHVHAEMPAAVPVTPACVACIEGVADAHLCVADLGCDDHLVQLLLMAFHLRVLLDLADGHVLLVAQGDDLVECGQQLERGGADALLVHRRQHVLGEHLAEQAQRLQVLQDVAGLVGDQQQVQAL